MVGINNATAKDIVRKYRKTGAVFIRKEEMEKNGIGEEELEPHRKDDFS